VKKKETEELKTRLGKVEEHLEALAYYLGVELEFTPDIFGLFHARHTLDYRAVPRPGAIAVRDDIRAQIAPILKHLGLEMTRKDEAKVPIHYEVKKKDKKAVPK
jgi:hypothetical protein